MNWQFSDIFYGLGLISSLGILISFLIQKSNGLSIHLYAIIQPSFFCTIGTIVFLFEDSDMGNLKLRFLLSLFASIITIMVSSILVDIKKRLFPPKN